MHWVVALSPLPSACDSPVSPTSSRECLFLMQTGKDIILSLSTLKHTHTPLSPNTHTHTHHYHHTHTPITTHTHTTITTHTRHYHHTHTPHTHTPLSVPHSSPNLVFCSVHQW